jgi:hypothetical protein
MFLKKNDTYTHFEYGAPQSAQNLYRDWFSRYSIISLALDGSVSDNNHCKWFFLHRCKFNTNLWIVINWKDSGYMEHFCIHSQSWREKEGRYQSSDLMHPRDVSFPHQIHPTSFKRNRAKTSSYKLLSQYTSHQHEDLAAGQVGECPSSVCNACLERQGNTEDCSPPSCLSMDLPLHLPLKHRDHK